MSEKFALVIDDERDIAELIGLTLSQMGFTCDLAHTEKSGINFLQGQSYQLCLTDLRLPDGSGMNIVKHIQKNAPNTPVAVISAHGAMDNAIEAMKLGAFDFVKKPVDNACLEMLANSALRVRPEPLTSAILGESPATLSLLDHIQKVAKTQAPVFIHGPSGAGKELAAREIHRLSVRHDGPFVAVNCGAIPRDLIETELFGYKKGAFTGANSDKRGLFESASGGTLFLDEIADLPLDMQVKLLRVLQEKRIRRVGDNEEMIVDVRVLSATHRDLKTLVSSNLFREDLFYRINVIELKVPSLSERRSDIPLLADALLTKIGSRKRLSASASEKLMSYAFPGNVRELENILERASALTEVDCIECKDINFPVSEHRPEPEAHPQVQNQPLDEQLAAVEKSIIVNALEAEKWHKTRTAERLGISFRALRYRLKKLGLD